jgi:hypothetical protein
MMTQKQAREAGLDMLREGPELGDEVYPVVDFASRWMATDAAPGGIWVPRLSVQLKNPNSTTRASRCQVPLVLAWWAELQRPGLICRADSYRAMTIHKSQGQTIERLKISAKKIFESGACARVVVHVRCVRVTRHDWTRLASALTDRPAVCCAVARDEYGYARGV